MNICVQFFVWMYIFSSVGDIWMSRVSSSFWRTSSCFQVVVLSYLPTGSMRVPVFPHLYQGFNSCPNGCEVICHVVLISISLINNVEVLSMSLLAFYVCTRELSIQILCPFLNWLNFFFKLYKLYDLGIFSMFCSLFFHFIMCLSFKVQAFLIFETVIDHLFCCLCLHHT